MRTPHRILVAYLLRCLVPIHPAKAQDEQFEQSCFPQYNGESIPVHGPVTVSLCPFAFSVSRTDSGSQCACAGEAASQHYR